MRDVRIDGHKYVREANDSRGEVLTISEVRPIYRMMDRVTGEQTSLLLAFTEMPLTRFRPGMKIRVIIEK